jgi:hypothetical protein
MGLDAFWLAAARFVPRDRVAAADIAPAGHVVGAFSALPRAAAAAMTYMQPQLARRALGTFPQRSEGIRDLPLQAALHVLWRSYDPMIARRNAWPSENLSRTDDPDHHHLETQPGPHRPGEVRSAEWHLQKSALLTERCFRLTRLTRIRRSDDASRDSHMCCSHIPQIARVPNAMELLAPRT